MVAFSGRSRPAVGPRQFSIQWVRGDFPSVRRPKREGDHSPLSSADDKSAWSNTSTPPHAVIVWFLLSTWAALPL